MHTIPLPDPLYIEAQRAATACGMSIESFIVEAVRLHLDDDLHEENIVVLAPEQVAIVRRGQSDIKAGRGATMEQAEQRLAAKKAAWLQTNPR